MPNGYKNGKPDIQWWVGQINKGKNLRYKRTHQDQWETWRRWYRGEWAPGILPSNVYFKLLRTLIPRIYYRNPSISITPSIPGIENMLLCKVMERADNKLIDLMNVKGSMKRAVQHGIMFGTGFLRQGYGGEFTPTPDDISTEAPDAGTRRLRRSVEYNSLVHPNRPWLLPAHPGQMILPYDCTTIYDARWVCYECIRPTDDIEDDPRFKNADFGAGQGNTNLLARPSGLKQELRDGVLLWEIRDKMTGKVFVIAPHARSASGENGVILFYEDDDLQVDRGFTVYPIIFNGDDESFWGVPLSQIVAPQQDEKNDIRTQIRRHRRIAIAKILAEVGAITPDEKSKLINGDAGAVVEVSNMAAVKQLEAQGIPTGLIETEEIVNGEIQELFGLGVNQFGEYAPGSADRSATEANIVNQATNIRIDENRDVCADALAEITSDMNHIIMNHWDAEMVLDIVGPAGVPIWIKFQPKSLRNALYEMKVDPDTSLPQTKQLREQKAVQSYGILKTNPLINPVELTRFLLNEMYGVDADSLMMNPLMQTQPGQPLDISDAARAMRAVPPQILDELRQRLATQPAEIIKPTLSPV